VVVANAAGSIAILSLSGVQGKSAPPRVGPHRLRPPKTLAITAPLAIYRQSIPTDRNGFV